MEYIKVKPKKGSSQEKIIIDMCYEHFGEKPPYRRKLNKKFIHDTTQEIINGDTWVVQKNENSIVGICIICPCNIDKRIKTYALENNSDYFLAALIIDERYRNQGHATKILQEALKGKNGNLILITPEINKPSIKFYNKVGMSTVANFPQNEQKFDNNEMFDLHRVVMCGSITKIINSL